MIKREEWIWKGLPGHFICANKCIFRLHTVIGKYRISTVGAMYEGNKMEEIGLNRHYETFVFIGDGCKEIDSEGVDLKDFKDPYLADEQASKNHMRMCEKYSKERQ